MVLWWQLCYKLVIVKNWMTATYFEISVPDLTSTLLLGDTAVTREYETFFTYTTLPNHDVISAFLIRIRITACWWTRRSSVRKLHVFWAFNSWKRQITYHLCFMVSIRRLVQRSRNRSLQKQYTIILLIIRQHVSPFSLL